MSDTAAIAAINLQVYAHDAAAIAIMDGSYVSRRAADKHAFIWQGGEQTIPMGIAADPAGYARALRRALPVVNTLRLPFNAQSFNPDGSLDARYEAFLSEAVRQQFNILFVYADGPAQRMGQSSDPLTSAATTDQIRAALAGPILTRAKNTFGRMLDWIDRHPEVAPGVWGLELVNEPATWQTAFKKAPSESRAAAEIEFTTLYAQQMIALAQVIAPRFKGRILIGGMGYSAKFDGLAATPMPDGGSALDAIRKAVGSQLMWSAHLYPGWGATKHAKTPDEAALALDAQYAMLGADDILLTETNANAAMVYNPFSARQLPTVFATGYEWFADRGIGLSWFPGAQIGGASLVTMGADLGLNFLNLPSYGAAMNGMTLARDDPALAGDDRITASLIEGRVRTQKEDPERILAGIEFAPVQGIALGLGGAGNDTIAGVPDAANFLYGGTGNDVITGASWADYAYGQDGHDTLDSGGGGDHLFGGRGNDLLMARVGFNELYGGPGADRFSVSVIGKTVLADFNAGSGDTIDFRGHYADIRSVLVRTAVTDYDGQGGRDLIVWHGTGGYTVILGAGADLNGFAAALAEFPAGTPIPQVPEAERLTGTPFTPANRVNPEGVTPTDPPAEPPPEARINGTAGNDTIAVTDGNDVIDAGAGDDTILERKGRNLIFAGPGNDTIATGHHHSTILAGDGNDSVQIEARTSGHDIWGGPGRDTFDVTVAMKPTQTVIYDFEPAEDRLFWKGQPIELAGHDVSIVAEPFLRGNKVTLGGVATLWLIDPALAKTVQALPADTYTPAWDPANPTAHAPG